MKRFILLITNNEKSPYIVQEDGYLSIIIDNSSNISEAVACLTEQPTHIYYDLEHGLTRGEYENKVKRVRAVCKQLFPDIPALKAELFLTKQEQSTMQDNDRVNAVTHNLTDEALSDQPETAPIVYEFEEAIRMIKTGDVAMRPLHAPVDSFVSKTDGSQLPSNKFWSKYNKAVAEQRPNKVLKVNSSFTKFLGGIDGVTMGWVPTNEEMWSKWVIEGTALYPSQIQLSADHDSLYIRYDLYRGRGVLDKATKFAGPFNLAYDTIFPAILDGGKVGFLTNNLDADVAAFDRKLITVILNDMIDFHANSNDEFAHSNIVMSHEDADTQPYFVVEHTINFASDDKYTHESAALWNELKAEEIEVLIVDLDAFEDHSLKDDILKQLNWLSEQQDNFTWVALSIQEDIEVEVIDLGDDPDQQ